VLTACASPLSPCPDAAQQQTLGLPFPMRRLGFVPVAARLSSHGGAAEFPRRRGRVPAGSGVEFRRRSGSRPGVFPFRDLGRRSRERGSPRRPAIPVTKLQRIRSGALAGGCAASRGGGARSDSCAIPRSRAVESRDSSPNCLQPRLFLLEEFVIIGLQSYGFRYNMTLNICLAKMTSESLMLCYYNI